MASLFRRRRSWPWLAAGLLVAVLVAVALVVRNDEDGSGRGLADPSPSGSGTPSSPATSSPPPESPSPTASPSPSPTGSPSPSPSASPSPPRPTAPSATAGQTGPPGDRPDGVAGWDTGAASCRQATLPGTSTAPYPGLSVELLLPSNSFRTGHPVLGTVRISNSGETPMRFRTYDAGDDGTLLDAGRAVSAVYSGIRATVEWDVPPGGSSEREVTVEAESCGDTSGQGGRPLPTDRAYQAVVTLRWERPGGSGEWTTAPRTLTLFS